MNKLLISFAVIVAFASYSVAMAGEGQGYGAQKTQELSEAGVTVKVSLEAKGDTITARIALNTHSVALDQYKFDEIVVLRAVGKEYKGKVVSLQGAGHHRSAVIEFNNPKTKEVEIVIKNVAGVKERIFKF